VPLPPPPPPVLLGGGLVGVGPAPEGTAVAPVSVPRDGVGKHWAFREVVKAARPAGWRWSAGWGGRVPT